MLSVCSNPVLVQGNALFAGGSGRNAGANMSGTVSQSRPAWASLEPTLDHSHSIFAQVAAVIAPRATKWKQMATTSVLVTTSAWIKQGRSCLDQTGLISRRQQEGQAGRENEGLHLDGRIRNTVDKRVRGRKGQKSAALHRLLRSE